MSTTSLRARPAILIALLVAISIVAACAGAAPSPSGSGSGLPAAGPTVTVEDAIDVFADAGIAIFDDTSDTTPIQPVAEPVSPFALLRFQVTNLVRDANAGGGVPADLVDDLIPMPDDTVSFSGILAGYAATATTPGGRLTAELMAGQDLTRVEELWFPAISLALFVGETSAAAADLAETGAGGRAGPAARAPTADLALAVSRAEPRIELAALDPCGQFSNWFAGIIEGVSNAILSVVPRIPFIGAAIEWALKGLAGLAADAIKEVLAHVPFLDALKKGVQALALAVTVVAALRDWPVTVTASPTEAHRTVTFAPNHVTLTARIDDGPGDVIPDAVKSCATLFGVTLPKGGAVGSTVDWRVVAGGYHLAAGLTSDKVVGESRTLKAEADMADEPLTNHERGPLGFGPIRVAVTVHRQDVKQIEQLIKGMITDAIPPVVWNAVVAFTGDPIRKLTAWTDPTGSGALTATYHDEPSPSPSPSDDPPPSEEPSASAPPTPDARDQFCTRYRALYTWSLNPTYEELSRDWARYLARAFVDMRPFAPANLASSLDHVIAAYTLYAEVDDPVNVPAAGPDASYIAEFLYGAHAYCGIPIT